MDRKIFAGMGAFFLAVAAWALPQAGAPVFFDDFESNLTFAENWTARSSVSQDGRLSAVPGDKLELRRELPQEFYIECDLTLQGDMGKPQGYPWRDDSLNESVHGLSELERKRLYICLSNVCTYKSQHQAAKVEFTFSAEVKNATDPKCIGHIIDDDEMTPHP